MGGKLLFLAVFLLYCFTTFADDRDASTKVRVGDKVPAFSLRTLSGKKFNTKSLKGKVVFINFFATWCPYCITEMPFIQKNIYEEIKDNNFVTIVIGRAHTKSELKAFKKKNKLTFPIAADPEEKAFNLFASKSIPRNFVIGKDGKIKYMSIGFGENEFRSMISIIKKELRVKSVAPKRGQHAKQDGIKQQQAPNETQKNQYRFDIQQSASIIGQNDTEWHFAWEIKVHNPRAKDVIRNIRMDFIAEDASVVNTITLDNIELPANKEVIFGGSKSIEAPLARKIISTNVTITELK